MAKSTDTMNDVAEEMLPAPDDRADPGGDRGEAESAEPSATARAVVGRGPAASEDFDAVVRQRDEYYDRLLRKAAEFDNYRKRVERERRDQADYAAADVLGDLLPLVDDLERALQADPAAGTDAYRTGVELIHRQMLDLLRRRGVTPIESIGREFDPNVHQAVIHETVPGHPEGEIVEEFRRGYKLRDRLLRPSMVKVAKA